MCPSGSILQQAHVPDTYVFVDVHKIAMVYCLLSTKAYAACLPHPLLSADPWAHHRRYPNPTYLPIRARALPAASSCSPQTLAVHPAAGAATNCPEPLQRALVRQPPRRGERCGRGGVRLHRGCGVTWASVDWRTTLTRRSGQPPPMRRDPMRVALRLVCALETGYVRQGCARVRCPGVCKLHGCCCRQPSPPLSDRLCTGSLLDLLAPALQRKAWSVCGASQAGLTTRVAKPGGTPFRLQLPYQR